MKKKQVLFKADDGLAIDNSSSSTGATKPATKFGGQPDWLGDPQWPISRTTGAPMDFVCQVSIDKDLFPDAKGEMAYLFIAGYIEGKTNPEFWNSSGGDNAVIIQPEGKLTRIKTSRAQGSQVINPIFSSNYKPGSLEITDHKAAPEYVELKPLATGPSAAPLQPFALEPGEDPEDSEFDYDAFPEENDEFFEAMDEFYAQLAATKIGGTPYFVQRKEYPSEKSVRCLLLQIDCSEFPVLNDGFIHVFINKKGNKGQMTYQR